MRLLLIALLALPFLTSRASADEFPFRSKYPQLHLVTTQWLSDEYDKVLIVDVRSKFEYDVVHIKDAINIPISTMEFASKLEAARPKESDKKIVFYCNGKSCEKSYEAGDAAEKNGFTNTFVYDAGVFDWVEAHPNRGAFFGVSPVDKTRIISPAALKAKMLKWDEFKAGGETAGNAMIDVREPIQRKVIPNAKGIKSIQLDRLGALLENHVIEGSTLYFMDATGKQVQWLQYYLEKLGYKNYYFLENGVDGVR